MNISIPYQPTEHISRTDVRLACKDKTLLNLLSLNKAPSTNSNYDVGLTALPQKEGFSFRLTESYASPSAKDFLKRTLARPDLKKMRHQYRRSAPSLE